MNKNILRILYLATIITLIAATYMVFTSPPITPDRPPLYTETQWQNLLQTYRIFYFHVPLAWVSYVAFFVVFIASIRYLQTSDLKWDVFAASSAEIGVVFCLLNILSGMIWAKGTWGESSSMIIYWDWSPRLTLQLILFLLYLAYVMIRGAMGLENRERVSAVFGIIAFIAVPMSYLSIKIWDTGHPDLTGPEGGIESPIIIYTLLINLLAYTLLYISLLVIRLENERAAQESRNP